MPVTVASAASPKGGAHVSAASAHNPVMIRPVHRMALLLCAGVDPMSVLSPSVFFATALSLGPRRRNTDSRAHGSPGRTQGLLGGMAGDFRAIRDRSTVRGRTWNA